MMNRALCCGQEARDLLGAPEGDPQPCQGGREGEGHKQASGRRGSQGRSQGRSRGAGKGWEECRADEARPLEWGAQGSQGGSWDTAWGWSRKGTGLRGCGVKGDRSFQG